VPKVPKVLGVPEVGRSW